MTRKVKVTFSAKQKLEYAKLMVEGGYSNIQVEKISGAGKSAVSRWKQQYLAELNGNTPVKSQITSVNPGATAHTRIRSSTQACSEG